MQSFDGALLGRRRQHSGDVMDHYLYGEFYILAGLGLEPETIAPDYRRSVRNVFAAGAFNYRIDSRRTFQNQQWRSFTHAA